MQIFLSLNTAGRCSSQLKGNLKYFDHLIQCELNNSNFKTSFEEFWLTLSYPPMYALDGVMGIEIDFKEFYDKYPYSRINRKLKTIEIILKAPEFSEHCDKEKQIDCIYKLDIEQEYKNISDINLAKILINKFLEAGKIIKSKLKKTDIFDLEDFNLTLTTIERKINLDFLIKSQVEQEAILHKEVLSLRIQEREKRMQQNLPKDKLIKDLRVYCNKLSAKALYPYSYIYSEIFLNLLKQKQLKCPKYNHLYIQVATTTEDALYNSCSLEDWHTHGISVIDYQNYLKQSETEKQNIVFNVILNGLKDIFTLDKLNNKILEEVTELINQKGINTELEYKIIENNNYKLKITYFSKSREEESPIFFNLTVKESNQTYRLEIGKSENSKIPIWLQKISLTSKQIKIQSSDSAAAGVWLKNKSRKMEFEISDVMTKGESI